MKKIIVIWNLIFHNIIQKGKKCHGCYFIYNTQWILYGIPWACIVWWLTSWFYWIVSVHLRLSKSPWDLTHILANFLYTYNVVSTSIHVCVTWKTVFIWAVQTSWRCHFSKIILQWLTCADLNQNSVDLFDYI